MGQVEERGVAILEAGVCGDAARPVFSPDLSRVANLLAHRGATHGVYERQATVAQKIKAIWEDTPNWERLSDPQRESLHMIAAKISRILCGNPCYKDHWADLAGYAQLVADDL